MVAESSGGRWGQRRSLLTGPLPFQHLSCSVALQRKQEVGRPCQASLLLLFFPVLCPREYELSSSCLRVSVCPCVRHSPALSLELQFKAEVRSTIGRLLRKNTPAVETRWTCWSRPEILTLGGRDWMGSWELSASLGYIGNSKSSRAVSKMQKKGLSG